MVAEPLFKYYRLFCFIEIEASDTSHVAHLIQTLVSNDRSPFFFLIFHMLKYTAIYIKNM